jgi:hypothetical protein
MGKLIVLVLIAALACRMLTGHWPWGLWSVSERSQQEAMARQLLGVNAMATRADIGEAHRRLIARVHPDRGGTSQAVYQANAARDLLLARLDRIETGRK